MSTIRNLFLSLFVAIFAFGCSNKVADKNIATEPKEEETKALRETVAELKEVVEILRDHAVDNKVDIAKVEENAKSAHKRLDGLSERLHEVEQRCVNCQCRSKG